MSSTWVMEIFQTMVLSTSVSAFRVHAVHEEASCTFVISTDGSLFLYYSLAPSSQSDRCSTR